MSDSLREDILTSEAAKRMVATVTPIYDNSYVGLWTFEAMGREFDSLLALIESLKTELDPESATWMLELWERRYGITPPIGSTYEQRRRAIVQMRALPSPLTPYKLEQYLEAITGRTVHVIENPRTYTFEIVVESDNEDEPLNYDVVKKYVKQHKPSHMAFEMFQEAAATIVAKVETAYWRFYYTPSGTIPQTNIEAGLADGEIAVAPEGVGYKFDYHTPGTADAGTAPQTNIIGGVGDPGVAATMSGTAYSIPYPPCGIYSAGGTTT